MKEEVSLIKLLYKILPDFRKSEICIKVLHFIILIQVKALDGVTLCNDCFKIVQNEGIT